MKKLSEWLVASCVLVLLSAPALAHDDHDMVQKMRMLGLDVGNAYACTAEADRDAFREKSEHLYVHILEDHGVSAAYAYAASVGYGAARDVSTIDCDTMTRYWADLTEKLSL